VVGTDYQPLGRLVQSGGLGGAGGGVTLFVVRMLAPFIASPVAGVVADRYNRKWILITTDIARIFTAAGFLLVDEPDEVWLLYLFSGLQMGISGFFYPARTAILPDIVPERAIGAANALTSATWSVMLALGAALGGVVAGTWGLGPAFLIDAVTFVLSALCIARIRLEVKPGLNAEEQSIGAALRQYLDGLRYLGRDREVAATTLHKSALMLCFGAPMEVINVAIARDVLILGEGGSLGLGMIYAMVGIGTGLGPIIARAFTGDRLAALRWALGLAYGLTSVGLWIVGTLDSVEIVLLGIFLRGCGSGIIWVFSSEYALHALTSAVGAGLGGQYLEVFGIAGGLHWLAATTLLPGVLWGCYLIRTSRPFAADS
jgi:MFS family permease